MAEMTIGSTLGVVLVPRGMVLLRADSTSDYGKRVWLDGVDVSMYCFRALVPEAPGVEGNGFADIYLHDEAGALELNEHGSPRWERHPGRVLWRLGVAS